MKYYLFDFCKMHRDITAISDHALKQIAKIIVDAEIDSRVVFLRLLYGQQCGPHEVLTERELCTRILECSAGSRAFDNAIHDLLDFYQELKTRTTEGGNVNEE